MPSHALKVFVSGGYVFVLVIVPNVPTGLSVIYSTENLSEKLCHIYNSQDFIFIC